MLYESHLRRRHTRTHTRGSSTGALWSLDLVHQTGTVASQHSGLLERRGDGKVPQEPGREMTTQQQFFKWETQGVHTPGGTGGHLLHFPAVPPQG